MKHYEEALNSKNNREIGIWCCSFDRAVISNVYMDRGLKIKTLIKGTH